MYGFSNEFHVPRIVSTKLSHPSLLEILDPPLQKIVFHDYFSQNKRSIRMEP